MNPVLKLVEAIISAAEQVGEDGCGKHGLVGYFLKSAETEPNNLVHLLVRALPYQNHLEEHPREKQPKTREEIEQTLRDMGIAASRASELSLQIMQASRHRTSGKRGDDEFSCRSRD